MTEREVVYGLYGLEIAIKDSDGRKTGMFHPTRFDEERQMTPKERALMFIGACGDAGVIKRSRDYLEVEAVNFETTDHDCTPILPLMPWREYVERGKPETLVVKVNASYEVLPMKEILPTRVIS